LPSGPYPKSMERFVECLDTRLEKDVKYTLHQVSDKCEINEQTVESYAYQNLSELNKHMLEKGKKVKQETIKKEFKGLVVDPPSRRRDALVAGLLVSLPFLAALAVGVKAGNRSTLKCGKCGTQINLTGCSRPSFLCPKCGQLYVRQRQLQN